MIIRFMKRAGIYNAGEVAGFLSPHEEKIALDYVQRGVAVECDKDGNPIEPRPAEGHENANEGGEGEKAPDLGSLSKPKLVALAEEREITVTRAEGEGEPLKSDYVRALTEADEGADADEGEGEGEGDNEGDDDQSDEPSS